MHMITWAILNIITSQANVFSNQSHNHWDAFSLKNYLFFHLQRVNKLSSHERSHLKCSQLYRVFASLLNILRIPIEIMRWVVLSYTEEELTTHARTYDNFWAENRESFIKTLNALNPSFYLRTFCLILILNKKLKKLFLNPPFFSRKTI